MTELVERSLRLIHEYQAETGAYPAAPGPAPYRNAWLRDGAFVADAMSRAGQIESAERFFGWCAAIVLERCEVIDRLVERHRAGNPVAVEEHLHARYTLSGREVPEAWPSFQLDGWGEWLWALNAHVARHGRELSSLRDGVEPILVYLSEFALEPTYDWWEERLGQHSTTLAAVGAGLAGGADLAFVCPTLREAARRKAAEVFAVVRGDAEARGRLGRSLGDDLLDGSLIACATPFRTFEPHEPVMAATVAALEAELAHGGVHRYPGDSFYGGGEWLLLAALLGWHYVELGRRADARAQLEWIAGHARGGGELPEQVEDHLLVPEGLEEWRRRWGPSASPLLWSHAMFVTLALELGESSR